MSAQQEYYVGSNEVFLTNEEARIKFNLSEHDSSSASEIDRQLVKSGIAKVALNVTNSDFITYVNSYEHCIDEHPKLLEQTYHKIDNRFGNEAGHVRKEAKIDSLTGIQVQDAKSLIHVNEQSREIWQDKFNHSPKAFKTFLNQGYELHHALVDNAKLQIATLEETHPHISEVFFPVMNGLVQTFSFMRTVSYDSYPAEERFGDVAKPHWDIGGITFQEYSDAPGFWYEEEKTGQRIYVDSEEGYAQMFMGIGYRKLYGQDARIKAKRHGVGRIITPGQKIIPKRRAIILFIDAPFIDFGVTEQDTLPQLAEIKKSSESRQLLAGY
jgi:hypothetical protein